MTKRQLIDEIMGINRSAQPEFLAHFSDEDLNEYLEHLKILRTPRLSGDPRRYDAYFENVPTIAVGSAAGSPGGSGAAAGESLPQHSPPAGPAGAPGAEGARADDQGARKPFASQQGSQSWLF